MMLFLALPSAFETGLEYDGQDFGLLYSLSPLPAFPGAVPRHRVVAVA